MCVCSCVYVCVYVCVLVCVCVCVCMCVCACPFYGGWVCKLIDWYMYNHPLLTATETASKDQYNIHTGDTDVYVHTRMDSLHCVLL